MYLQLLLLLVWPILLRQKLSKDLKMFFLERQLILQRAIFTSMTTLEAAIKLRQEITAALAKSGFHNTKWTSSSPELLAAIPKEVIAVDCCERTLEDCCSMPNKTALGIKWDIRPDKLEFFMPKNPRTRGEILSMLILLLLR